MPKVAKELTALDIKRLEKPGFHAAGGVPGLLMQVTATGGKSWVLRTMVGGKRRWIGLGGYPAVGLGEAKVKARETLGMTSSGKDPIIEKAEAKRKIVEQQSVPTFSQAVEKYIAAFRDSWTNPKHAAQWTNTLKEYAEPELGGMFVDKIQPEDVMRAIGPIWNTKNETASRVRGRIEKVIGWAVVMGYRSKGANPAAWKDNLDHLLPARAKVLKTQHHASLPHKDVGAFMLKLAQDEDDTAKCLRLIVLTTVRYDVGAGALWSEFDLDGKVWHIPAERMKMDKPLHVPLSSSVVKLLKSMKRRKDDDVVFRAQRGGKIHDAGLKKKIVEHSGQDVTTHGFRSTFRDWVEEEHNEFSRAAEYALGHKLDDATEAAYQRSDLFERRVVLMTMWDDYCGKERKSADVIDFTVAKK